MNWWRLADEWFSIRWIGADIKTLPIVKLLTLSCGRLLKRYQAKLLDASKVEVLEVLFPSDSGKPKLEYLVNGFATLPIIKIEKLLLLRNLFDSSPDDKEWGRRCCAYWVYRLWIHFGKLFLMTNGWNHQHLDQKYYSPCYSTINSFAEMRTMVLCCNLFQTGMKKQNQLWRPLKKRTETITKKIISLWSRPKSFIETGNAGPFKDPCPSLLGWNEGSSIFLDLLFLSRKICLEENEKNTGGCLTDEATIRMRGDARFYGIPSTILIFFTILCPSTHDHGGFVTGFLQLFYDIL